MSSSLAQHGLAPLRLRIGYVPAPEDALGVFLFAARAKLEVALMDVLDLIGVRERIQTDHAELRVLLEGLAVAANGVFHHAGSGHEEAAVSALHLAVAALVTRFTQHLEMEESNLLPILRKQDGWGDVRAEEVLFEHQEQRLVLAAMLEDVPRTAMNLDLVGELRRFILWLLRDMDLEELMLNTLVRDACVGPSSP